MSAPFRHPIVLAPPHPKMTREEKDFHTKTIWERTGGKESAIYNLRGLQASVTELNTLVGIATTETVQQQLNRKANSADLGTIASQDANNVLITGGNISDTDVQSSNIKIEAGLTASYLNVGGTLQVDTTSVGNTAGVETNLITYNIPAKTLSQNKTYLEVTAFGTIAANANLKEIKLILGTTTLLTTGSLGTNGGSWQITAKIIRIGASAEKCISAMLSSSTLIVNETSYVAAAEDLETALTVKCTGNGVAASDVVQEGLIIKWNKL